MTVNKNRESGDNKFYHVVEHEEHSIGRFNIIKDTILIGQETYPYSYEQVDNCACVLPIYNGRVVLIKQYRHTFRQWLWELPAGGLGGDPPEIAAKRELAEETGYVANKVLFLGKYPVSQGTSTAVAHIFVAECSGKHKQNLEKTELIEVYEVEINEFEEMIRRREFTHMVGVLAWFLYKQRV